MKLRINNKKIKRVINISLIIVILIIIFFLIQYFTSRFPKSKDNIFIPFNASITNNIDSSFTMQLPYFDNNYNINKLSVENIENISIEKSKILEIESFEILEGKKTKNYKNRTLCLNLKNIKKGNENINYININLKNGKKLKYFIGNWNFNVLSIVNNDKNIELVSNIAISEKLNYYELDIINKNKNTIILKDIMIDNTNFEYDFEPISINSNKKLTTRIYIKSLVNKNNFYVIKPAVSYEINGEESIYFPYETIYGIINITEEMLDSLIKNNKYLN